MKIPIAMVCDQNYISQTRVTIWTMRKSTSEDAFLEITVLCSNKLKENEKKRLQELENILINIKIIFYVVNDEIFQNANETAHLPVTSYYRLIISEAIQESKCLFLDGDIIVKTDLRALYLCELGNCYIAGVRNMPFFYQPNGTKEYAERYGFRSIENYVNAGVMVFNLDKIREDHLQGLFLQNIDRHYPTMDQDILNMVCQDKIMQLDLKYNMICGYELKNVSDGIIHFAGKYKPWNNYRIRWAREWWDWAKEALEAKEYDELYRQAVSSTECGDWSYIARRCQKEEVAVIIGYSNIGCALGQALKRGNDFTKIYYCDNSEAKQSLSNDSVRVYSIEELVERYQDALWINTSQYFYRIINEQLRKLGVMEEQIINYKEKPMSYYELLEDEFMDYELHQLQLRVTGRH